MLRIRLPIFPETVDELRLIRYWLRALASAYFEESEMDRGCFNPRFFDRAFSLPNDKKPKILIYSDYLLFAPWSLLTPALASLICTKEFHIHCPSQRDQLLQFLLSLYPIPEEVNIYGDTFGGNDPHQHHVIQVVILVQIHLLSIHFILEKSNYLIMIYCFACSSDESVRSPDPACRHKKGNFEKGLQRMQNQRPAFLALCIVHAYDRMPSIQMQKMFIIGALFIPNPTADDSWLLQHGQRCLLSSRAVVNLSPLLLLHPSNLQCHFIKLKTNYVKRRFAHLKLKFWDKNYIFG
jgi:hypothetical protein